MTTPNPTSSNSSLICPKCNGEMRPYERSGVTIDQCADCRGIFLDRGELELLIDANESYYARSREEPQGSDRSREEAGGHGGGHGSSSGHGRGSSASGQESKKRRGGFLGGLFDD